ncbi:MULTISPECIES: acyl-CoA dehydrogenase [Luteimonas]|uniref:acyl-CoA dehydrogenase n=1 Tax=Luteimonas TaxID=83614 RepID=UPI0018ECC694|nr:MULTISPECIES: acyl-CoA dehydrogenase [Luteimonas]
MAAPAALASFARDWRARCPELPRPGGGDTLSRWRTLAAIAREDVCGVKVMEAHYDARAILDELDHAPGPIADALYAVWAAEPPDARLTFARTGAGAGRVDGIKAWCSGADLVDAALVTAHDGDRRVLVQVVLDQPGITRVAGDWQAVGMARVESGRLSFQGADAVLVGAPGAYLDRPGFWHGGGGIAACWYGAATAIADTLRRAPRAAKNPHAMAHLGAIDMVLSAAAALLRETAAQVDAVPQRTHATAVTRVRSVVERTATEVIDRVGRALGPGPLCEDGAHARRCADLTTFLRQSHAERDWATLGDAAREEVDAWSL